MYAEDENALRSGRELTVIYHFPCNGRSFRSAAAMPKARSPSSIISAGWSSKLRHDAAMIGLSAVFIILNNAWRDQLPRFCSQGPQNERRGQRKRRVGKGVESNDDSKRLPTPDIPSCGTQEVTFRAF